MMMISTNIQTTTIIINPKSIKRKITTTIPGIKYTLYENFSLSQFTTYYKKLTYIKSQHLIQSYTNSTNRQQ